MIGPFFVDTNVLIRCMDYEDPKHRAAFGCVCRLLDNDEILYISLQNLVEFWVVATRSRDVNGLGWDFSTVLREMDYILSLFTVIDEVPKLSQTWLSLVQEYKVMGKQAHDTRLVAIMKHYKIYKIITFDAKDFRRYPFAEIYSPEMLTPK